MGPTTSFTNLLERIWNFLEEKRIILSQMDPGLITAKVWDPEGQETIILEDIWEGCFKYQGRPLPKTKEVVKESIKTPVRDGLFGITSGRPTEGKIQEVHYKESPPRFQIGGEWYLVRKGLAEKFKAREKRKKRIEEEKEEVEILSFSMQDTLEDYIPREDEPIGGKHDYDQAGKLVGNWFLEGSLDEYEDPISIEHKEIWASFTYDMANDSEIRIAVGGTLNCSTIAWKGEEGPDPAEVSADDGPTVYKLRGTEEFRQTDQTATMLVEVLDAEASLKVEAWNSTVTNPTFDHPTYYER